MDSLVSSIQTEGLFHPLVIMEKEGKQNEYLLLGGGRRIRAVQTLLWPTIACNVYPPLDAIDQKTIEQKENLERENLTPIEEALLTKEIHDLQVLKYGKADKFGGGHRLADTAKLIGKSEATVIQDIKIAEMAIAVPELSLCKTKSEALKMIDRATRAVETAAAVRNFESKTGLGLLDDTKARLLKAYQVGDAYKLIRGVPDNSVSIIELDPVYHIGLNKLKDKAADPDYQDAPPEDYYDNMLRILRECFRIAAPNSWIIVWYSIRWHHAETAKVIQDAGFKLNGLPCLWDHHYGQTLQPSTNLPSCYDSFFYARKGLPSLNRPGRSNVFDCKPVVASQKVHTIERPIQLMEDILSTFVSAGSSLLVPFAGSGNTLLAAGNLHMTCIGFDQEQNFCNEYLRKVQEGIPGCYCSVLVGSEMDLILKDMPR